MNATPRPVPSTPPATPTVRGPIELVVLEALRTTNLSREGADRLEVSPDAPLFGPDSPLDSLGLVALLLDIEEGLQAIGCHVLLSDDRAMSQKRSPFRSVQSLVNYISDLAGT